MVTTLAGSYDIGFADGPGTTARFTGPSAIDRGDDGTLYVADLGNARIRAVAPDGTVRTFSGVRGNSLIDGASGVATFLGPISLRIDWRGNLVVSEIYSHSIRLVKIADGSVTTLTGGAIAEDYVDGPIGTARFGILGGVDVDRERHRIFVADFSNYALREIDVDRGEVRTLVGNGTPGFVDGAGGRTGAARLTRVTRLAYDGPHNVVWFGDGNTVRRVHVDTLQVETVAGAPGIQGYVEGHGREARFYGVMGLSLGPDGLLYLCDQGNAVVRSMTWDGTTQLVAGTPGIEQQSVAIDPDGPALHAVFARLVDLRTMPDGTIYAADLNHIRVIR